MYREDKTTQMAARMLERAGGRLPCLLLLKMLFLADKRMLVTWGIPITYDRWAAMQYGPVLNNTLDIIRGKTKDSHYWLQHIATEGKYAVLKTAPGDCTLSRAEEKIIEEVAVEWGGRDRWDAVEFSHTLPEWSDPGQSSTPISYEEVLRVSGFSREDAMATLDNIKAQDSLSVLMRAA